MPSALIIGGTGQIGLAVAQRLSVAGWDIRLASRTVPPQGPAWPHVQLDRDDPGAIARALGQGADLLMDCVAFSAEDADTLLAVQADVGHIIAVSSASVYADATGRTLDEAGDCGFPHFPVPIPENHPTIAPGPQTYSTRKVAMEHRLRDHATTRVTILRPCAVHGPHSKHAREWWFVKRLLDGRRRIPLAYEGRSQFQTTSTDAIAEAVLYASQRPAAASLNVTDADAPTVTQIGQAIMATMGVDAELVLMPDNLYLPGVGQTPWSVERPMVCASSLPQHRGYAEAVPAGVAWLIAAMRGRDWHTVLPQLAAYPRDHFDYAVEDAAMAARG